ncbi:MAG TPA: DUF4019 domain-containing protein [Anaeromyxobacter sp.]|nr:DUF4019 domain-containing protein [Anaeromyxobacter sp.]
MNARVVVACVLVAAACSRGPDRGAFPGGGYSYLVTPSGRMFRLLRTGPMIGAEGKRLGAVVSYAGDTREVARITSDADEIVGALGPEMEASGEPAIIVQANLGWDPRKTISTSVLYGVVFERREDRWARLPPKPGQPAEVEGVAASPGPPDDPSFPFDPAAARDAAQAAARWVALLDASDADGSLAATTPSFRVQLEAELDTWRSLVAQRGRLGAAGGRVELYRMLTRNASVPVPAGGAVIVQYELRPPQGGRFLERVILLPERQGWRPAGYSFRPLAPP